jgi:tetratricopeptide (TPR) repeat protein
MFEEIGDKTGLGTSLGILGQSSFFQGKLNQAIKYLKQSLSSKMISNRIKADNLYLLGTIYSTRGEIDKALRYYKKVIALAENENFYDLFIRAQTAIGLFYFQKGEFDLAIEFLETSLSLAEKMTYDMSMVISLIFLGMVYHLERLRKLSTQGGHKMFSNVYQLQKAVFLIKTGGSRNRVEAETLLKQISTDATSPAVKTNSLIHLCEFYLEELRIFEDQAVLKEISPLISQIYKISEEQRMYGNLAEAKLLQAKVALIQMNFEEVQQLLTQAQRVAELYGIGYLAQKISSEHDKYLERLSEWKSLKEKDAPISERLKLVSVEGVIERLQGKRTIESPELVEEEPIVLLIIDKSGISYFNYPFRKDWDFEWLFSSFMSAFDTFSSEVFSESIDRIKIGENLILINPIESFLICYVIKGQSYSGLQKLNRFSEAIKNNAEIWETLSRAVQTGEELELNNLPSLEAIVSEVFNQ